MVIRPYLRPRGRVRFLEDTSSEGVEVNRLYLLLQIAPSGFFEGFITELVQVVLVLVGVCVLAIALARVLASRFPRFGSSKGPIHVVQRLALEQRRTLYLVRVGQRLLMIGYGEHHAPVLLAEFDAQNVPLTTDSPPGSATSGKGIYRHLFGRGQ
jgi:flagellar biogenesis protein FliO